MTFQYSSHEGESVSPGDSGGAGNLMVEKGSDA